MKEKTKISTIIPVYNGEKYIKRCLDSIISQSIGIENIEIIIINDGSTDDSKKIINKYIKEYKNIVYLEQENKGQGSARNAGLKKAKGRYISFVDCDDTIEANMYEVLIENIEKENYDIVTCDYNIITKDNKKTFEFRFIENENKNFVIMNTGPCNMIIKKEILDKKNFSFPEDIIYEDFASIPPLAIETKIKHIEKPLYNYYKNENSTMNQKKYNHKLEDVFIAYNYLEKNLLDTYPEELEFLYIKNVMMSASLRFIEFKDPNNQIKRIGTYAKKNYPNWKKNVYFKNMPIKKRLVAFLTFYNSKKILYILFLINRRIKK